MNAGLEAGALLTVTVSGGQGLEPSINQANHSQRAKSETEHAKKDSWWGKV